MSLLLDVRRRRRAYTLILLLCTLLVGCENAANIAPRTTVQGSSPTAAALASPRPTTTTSPVVASASIPPEITATATISTTEASPAASLPPPQNDALATIESLNANRVPYRDQVDLAFEYGRIQTKQRVVRTTPFEVKVGDKQSFNVTDIAASADDPDRNYVITATLVLILEHVLVYVEDGVQVDLRALERSSREFNDKIYPRTREMFGSEWTPGIDGDPRLTILNARIEGAGGYFSSADEVPRSVNRFSNEREMFYINVDSYIPGTPGYASTLAHEFQHMIEWNEAQRTPTWSNEGLSQLAQELNGYEDDVTGSTLAFLANPDRQLTTWAETPDAAIAHYGASYLFMSYFYEHYGEDLDLRGLIREAAGEQLQIFADIARGHNNGIQDFGDLFADWSVANLLNSRSIEEGRYAYEHLPETVQAEPLQGQSHDTVAQFGSDYWALEPSRSARVLRFDGSDTIPVVGAQPHGKAMWWSNRADDAHSTLTRIVDLRNVSSATLQFQLWYHIEEGWDYGFVSVSTDGGQRFTTLPGRHTITEDPQHHNFGNGYTGVSGASPVSSPEEADAQPRWVDEQIDLTPYAGKQILLRFSLSNDQGFNLPGMALDNIRIPEINFRDDADTGDAGWQANGFVRTDNQLDQQWEVRLVRIQGRNVEIQRATLDNQNQSEFRLEPNERGIFIVIATTPHTTERATYQLNFLQ